MRAAATTLWTLAGALVFVAGITALGRAREAFRGSLGQMALCELGWAVLLGAGMAAVARSLWPSAAAGSETAGTDGLSTRQARLVLAFAAPALGTALGLGLPIPQLPGLPQMSILMLPGVLVGVLVGVLAVLAGTCGLLGGIVVETALAGLNGRGLSADGESGGDPEQEES